MTVAIDGSGNECRCPGVEGPFPSRYVNLARARAEHGARVERLGRNFAEGDPLADEAVRALSPLPRVDRDLLVTRALEAGIDSVPEAPDALRALFAQVDTVPFWVDEARVERGGAAFLRAGILGGVVLAARSLVLGYCSPAGNKPLVLSGRLEEDASRRLAETSRFVQAVSLPRGMKRDGDGFKVTVKVRLVHAAVRRMLASDPRWRTEDWGHPINQVDMAGTTLLFSLIVLDGIQKLGFALRPGEREDLLHLWRYVAYLLGVAEDLRSATEAEARTLWDLISSTQADPDRDSRTLARALLESPRRGARTADQHRRARRIQPVAYAVSRHLLGDRFADLLGYPRTPTGLAVKAFELVNRNASFVWRFVPDVPFGQVDAGVRYWQNVVDAALRGIPATFPMPDRLR